MSIDLKVDDVKELDVAVFCEYTYFDDVYKCFFGKACQYKLSNDTETVCSYHTAQALQINPMNYFKRVV